MPTEVRQLENAQIHRRKSSQDQGETTGVTPDTSTNESDRSGSQMEGATHPALPPSRIRVGSTPSPQDRPNSPHKTPPPSAGHHRTSFPAQGLPNGSAARPSSPFRSSFSIPAHPSSYSHSRSHSRTHSISTPFSPPLPSPLSSSFPHSHLHTHRTPAPTPATIAFPTLSTPQELTTPSTNGLTTPSHSRRHARLHSRNLSVFFPRPDSLPHPTIEEDGTHDPAIAEETVPVSTIPSAEPSLSVPTPGQLGVGFTFGGRPPNSAGIPGQPSISAGGTSRRGHHHKHSLSHNFFSFLEPGTTLTPGELHTQPTPIPVSPWNPISPFPSSAAPTQTSFFPPQPDTSTSASQQAVSPINQSSNIPATPSISRTGLVYSIGQFVLGAWLWMIGQQIGSLGCTGLGYWVVFDAMGIAIEWVAPGWLAAGEENAKTKLRRPYGNARIETVLMFAQAVYLMFASVYICKETVEHFLLSAGDGIGHGHGGGGHAGAEGHHHHRADEEGVIGVDFPMFLTFVTLLSLMATAFVYENHLKLVNIVNNFIPPISTLIRSIISPPQSYAHSSNDRPPEGILAGILSNPFIVSPMFFCLAILGIGFLVDPSYHRMCDLILASIETIVTFKLAYQTCVVLGTVLLQTSPPRGLSGGRMEAFLRVMKEVERHPRVLHLPAPHIWQVTPSYSSSVSRYTKQRWARGPEIVVTLELHVRADLDDEEVLKLTRWTWEMCVTALEGKGSTAEVEVTVGIVRG